MAKQGKEAAATFTQKARQDLADAELAQVKVIEEYLPKALSEAEIEVKVKEIIAQTGASTMKDMGRVMGLASKQLAGLADGGAISAIVKRFAGLIAGREASTNITLVGGADNFFVLATALLLFIFVVWYLRMVNYYWGRISCFFR